VEDTLTLLQVSSMKIIDPLESVVEYRAVAEAPVMASAKNAATASVRVIRWGRVGTLTPEMAPFSTLAPF
jgi:hypothetical protein